MSLPEKPGKIGTMIISPENYENDYYYEIVDDRLKFIGFGKKSKWRKNRFILGIPVFMKVAGEKCVR